MNSSKDSISVKIAGKEFGIKCSSDQIVALHEAATYLDEKINEISKKDKVINFDKLIVITALNITHELLMQNNKLKGCRDSVKTKIEKLENIIRSNIQF